MISLFAAVLGSGTHLGFHCIVFDLCEGTLYDLIKGYSGFLPLPARHVLEMAYQLVSGIACTSRNLSFVTDPY